MNETAAMIERVCRDFAVQFEDAVTELHRRGLQAQSECMRRRSYAMFYNDPYVTLKPDGSGVYLLGLNPGGKDNGCYEPETPDFWKQSCGKRRPGHPHSAYIDEAWTSTAGDSVHQRNVRRVLACLGSGDTDDVKTETTFAANLFFFRTPRGHDLREYPPELIDCWPYHEQFLAAVRPRLILCNGNSRSFSSFFVVHDKFGQGRPIHSRPLNKLRSVTWFSFQAPWRRHAPALVVGIPHASRPCCRIADVCVAVKEIAAEVRRD